jgi:DNA-binding SARP family transcriptional activator
MTAATVIPGEIGSRPEPANRHDNSSGLVVQYLGPFRVTLDGTRVGTTGSRRTRSMLAYLAAHRRSAVPRDVLMQVFWPEAGQAAARNNLHVALSGVRQVLRSASSRSVVERVGEAYRIAETVPVWTDVDAFEAAILAGQRGERAGDRLTALRCYERCTQLYQDDFLAEDPYLDWAAGPRDRYRLRAVEAQTRLLGLYLDSAEYGPAVLLGRRILATDPGNETVHRYLMAAYAATGYRHLALAQYECAAVTLRRMFGVRPSGETLSLYERLRHPGGTFQ